MGDEVSQGSYMPYRPVRPLFPLPVFDQAMSGPFAPSREIIKWLNMGNSRVVATVSGKVTRVPRQLLRRRRAASTSLEGLFNAQAGLCCYCTEPMTLPRTGRHKKWPTDAEVIDVQPAEPARASTEVTRDHLVPKSDGGPGLLHNFAAACRLCNQEKGSLPLVIFMLARSTNTVREVYRRQQHVRLALQAAKNT